MISSLLGKKIGMTQVYDAQNVLIPVTVVEAGPCSVVQVKTVETDGYNAVQLGFSTKKTKNSSAAELAHAKKAGLDIAPRVLGEVRLAAPATLKVGDVVTVTAFTEGLSPEVAYIPPFSSIDCRSLAIETYAAEEHVVTPQPATAFGDNWSDQLGRISAPARA